MLFCSRRDFPALGCALDKPDLDQVRLIYVLNRPHFFANRDGYGLSPDRSPVEIIGNHRQDAPVQIIKTQRETRFPGKKIFIWMHSWHAAKASESINCTIPGQPPLGTTSLGTRLFREYGPDYRVVTSVVAAPAAFVYPPGVVTIDNAFQRVFGAKPAYVDIHRLAPGQEKLPLDQMLPQYSHIDGEYGGGTVLKDQFDGIAYFPGSDLTIKKK